MGEEADAHEVAIEQRHDGPSNEDDQKLMVATLAGRWTTAGSENTHFEGVGPGLARRVVAAAPLI